MRYNYRFFDLNAIQTVEEAHRALMKEHVNTLLHTFGDDIGKISQKSLRFYFEAAAQIIRKKGLGYNRRLVCEKIVRIFAHEKMCGKFKDRKECFFTIEKKRRRRRK